MKVKSTTQKALLLALVTLGAVGCNTDMWREPKHDALDESDFFPDHASARPLVPGTIARDHLRQDDAYFTGQKGGKWLDNLPMPVTMELLKRGQRDLTSTAALATAESAMGKEWFRSAASTSDEQVGNYHSDRLRNMPVGHFYDVITNGYGTMFSYASRVEPQDRWAIAGYIRALQLSQHATPADADATALEASTKPAPTTENAEKPETP